MNTAAGLCGKPRVADIGGVPYLIPLAQRHKVGYYHMSVFRNNDFSFIYEMFIVHVPVLEIG